MEARKNVFCLFGANCVFQTDFSGLKGVRNCCLEKLFCAEGCFGFPGFRKSVADTLRLVSGAQHPGSAAAAYEAAQHFSDIREHLHGVKRDIEHLVQRNVVNHLPPL